MKASALLGLENLGLVLALLKTQSAKAPKFRTRSSSTKDTIRQSSKFGTRSSSTKEVIRQKLTVRNCEAVVDLFGIILDRKTVYWSTFMKPIGNFCSRFTAIEESRCQSKP